METWKIKLYLHIDDVPDMHLFLICRFQESDFDDINFDHQQYVTNQPTSVVSMKKV